MQYKIRLARVSYPNLFVATLAPGAQGEPKFSASFILDKERNAKDIEGLSAAMKAVALAKWGDKIPVGVKKFLRDGSEKADQAEYENTVFFNASSRNRPGVVDADPNIPLNQVDGRPYAGCYVNAVIAIWAQDNQFGKRVNAELKAVQFARDGEPLGAGAPVKPTEVFQNEEDPSDPDAVPTTARTEEAW